MLLGMLDSGRLELLGLNWTMIDTSQKKEQTNEQPIQVKSHVKKDSKTNLLNEKNKHLGSLLSLQVPERKHIWQQVLR